MIGEDLITLIVAVTLLCAAFVAGRIYEARKHRPLGDFRIQESPLVWKVTTRSTTPPIRTLCIALAGLTLAGCGPQMVQFDHAGLALLYADLKEVYGVVRLDLVRACTGPSARLDAATCGRLTEADRQLGEADAKIRAAILNPSKPVDYAQLGEFARALLKAGAASQTGGLSGLLLK